MSTKETGRTERLRTGKIGGLLWHFSVPSIVGMLANASYNIINRIFVGHAVGGIAIAAITVTFPLIMVFMGIALLVGIGATTLISIRLGQRKEAEAEVIMGNALTLLVALPLLLCLGLYVFVEPMLLFFGATRELLPYATAYMRVILPAMIVMSVSMGMNNIIRAEGSPRVAMLTQVLGGAVNVACNYLFVMRFGWGVRGAAWGVTLGQVFSMVWVLSYFFHPRFSYLKLRAANLKPRLSTVRSIAVIGMAPFIMQITAGAQQLVLNRVLSFYGGEIALAALGIISSLSMLLVMPIIGLSQGAQPIIGYNHGAKRYDRTREAWWKASVYATGFACATWVLIRVFPHQMAGVFISGEPETTALTAKALVVFFAAMMTVGFQVVSTGYFQAIGKPAQATVLALSRQVLIFIPLVLILPRFWQIDGAWMAAPLSDLAAFFITVGLIVWELRKSQMLTAKGAQIKTEEAAAQNRV